jgi:hypothetical protein
MIAGRRPGRGKVTPRAGGTLFRSPAGGQNPHSSRDRSPLGTPPPTRLLRATIHPNRRRYGGARRERSGDPPHPTLGRLGLVQRRL